MARDSEVNFREEEIRLQMGDVSAEILAALAFQIEAQTKVNIQTNGQVDTGFMLNSVYTVVEDGSTYNDAKGAAESQNAAGEMAPEVVLENGVSAAVVVGAEYAIYQEEKQSFLYAAAVQVGQNSGATIERVAKEQLGG